MYWRVCSSHGEAITFTSKLGIWQIGRGALMIVCGMARQSC